MRLAGAVRQRKAGEVERIDTGHQLAQHGGHIAQRQQQPHPAAVEVEAVQARRQWWPLPDQRAGQRRQPRVRRIGIGIGIGIGVGVGVAVRAGGMAVGVCQLGALRRVVFNRQVAKPVAAPAILPPGLPGGQKSVAQAKTGFQQHKPGPAGPARRQPVAVQQSLRDGGEGVFGHRAGSAARRASQRSSGACTLARPR